MTVIIHTRLPKRKRPRRGAVLAKKYVPEFRPLERRLFQERESRLPSHVMQAPLNEDLRLVETDQDPIMAEREQKARQEIERRRKMVAPLYNKGGYQYVGDAPPEIIQNLGRKV